MSLSNIKKKLQAQQGFTIVELLIVVVVIAILATITVVTYNGVTGRANTAAAKTSAQTAMSKIEAYAADGPTKAYPTLPSAIVGAAASTTYAFANTPFSDASSEPTTVPSDPNTLKFMACVVSAALTNTGTQVMYWDYSATTPAWTAVTTGTCAGTWTYKRLTATS